MSIPRSTSLRVAAAAGLIGMGLLPLTMASAEGCHALTDPKGDSEFKPQGAATLDRDPNLDILSIDYAVEGEMLVSTIKVADLINAPANHFGDQFAAGFSLGDKVVNAYVIRYDPAVIGTVADANGEGFYQQLLTVNGSAQPDVVVTKKYDEKADTVTISYKVADLERVTKGTVSGATLTKLTGYARAAAVATSFTYDTAAGTADYVLGACSAGSGAAPAAGASPAPSAAPSAAPSSAPSSAPSPAPSGSPSPAAGGAAAAPQLPKPDCGLGVDPKGDAKPLNSNTPNDPDLDLTGLTLGTTADSLVAFAKVDKLGAGPTQSTDGHRFTFYFTHNKNVFAMAGSAYKNAAHGQVRGAAASTGQFSAVTQLSVNGPPLTDPNGRTNPGFVKSGLKFTFEQKNSYVIATLPIADIETYGKAPFAGATLDGVYVTSATDSDLLASQADALPDGTTTTVPSKLSYTAGDNACFAPPVPALSSVGVVQAQHGDLAAVAGKVVGPDGAAVAGKEVTFAMGASTVRATTGADGVARASLPVKEKAGRRTLTVASGEDKLDVPFTVLVEKTVLTARGSGGAVTATLLDDDRKPVAGQVVTFTSGSVKKTARTDAKGVAKAGGFPAGSSVAVSYAGATGQFAASRTSARA